MSSMPCHVKPWPCHSTPFLPARRPLACLVWQAKVAQQVAQHPVSVLFRAVEEGCAVRKEKQTGRQAQVPRREAVARPGRMHAWQCHCLQPTSAALPPNISHTPPLTSLIVIGHLIVVLLLLAAVALCCPCRRRVPASRGGRAPSLHSLCSASIACCNRWSRHLPAIGALPGAWEGLLLTALSGAGRWERGKRSDALN